MDLALIQCYFSFMIQCLPPNEQKVYYEMMAEDYLGETYQVEVIPQCFEFFTSN